MLCPYCMELHEPAPSLTGEGPCSTPHCYKHTCAAECPECYDFFMALEPEEGVVLHPKAVRIPHAEGEAGPRKHGHRVEPGTPDVSPPPPLKKPPKEEIPW